jgi:hypothetical protein
MPPPPPSTTKEVAPWLIVLGSIAIVAHFLAVGTNVLAAPSGPWPMGEGISDRMPPPQFARDLNDVATPGYLQWVKMTHNYHFLSNSPGSWGVYLEAQVKDENDKVLATVRLPEKDANPWVRHRQEIFAQLLTQDRPVQPPQGEMIAAPGRRVQYVKIWEEVGPRTGKIREVEEHRIPRDRPVEGPSELSLLAARSYARYLCRTHGAAKVEVIRHVRQPVPLGVLSNLEPQAGAFEELKSNFGDFPR